MFTVQESHPETLDTLLLKEFGPESLIWEADTLWAEIDRSFGTTVSAINKDKIRAIRVVHLNEGFWDYWHIFEKVGQALDGNRVIPEEMQLLQPYQAAFVVDCVKALKRKKFSDEVWRYIAASLLNSGLVAAPAILKRAQPFIDGLTPKTEKALDDLALQLQDRRIQTIEDYVKTMRQKRASQQKMIGL